MTTYDEVPEGIKGQNLPKQPLDGEVLGVLTGQVAVPKSMPVTPRRGKCPDGWHGPWHEDGRCVDCGTPREQP